MKKFNCITALLLNVVTCGIYSLYMWYVMAKNTNAIAAKEGKKTIMGFIPAFLLGFVTFNLYPIYWYYKFFKLHVELAKEKNVAVKPVDNAILLTVLCFVPIYSFYMICDVYNNTVDAAA